MKKLIILSLFALCATTASQAKVWRVNNNAGVDADFTNISTAIANASVVSGDTIYVEPSSSTYNISGLAKQLTIIGNGYLLDTTGANNGNPGLQENVLNSKVSTVTLNAGSEGSSFIGLYFGNYNIYFSTIADTANIKVERCYRPNFYFYNNTSMVRANITIRKCYRPNEINKLDITFHNLIFENNIIKNSSQFYLRVSATSTNCYFRNNTIEGSPRLANIYVANNVFLKNYTSTFTSCVVKNNVFVFNQTGITTGPLSTNGNNLVNQTRASLILDTGSDDGKYQLAASSPAIGGGVDILGTKPDCGAFGGTDPYVLSGIPNIPTIYSLSFPNGNTIPSGSSSIEQDISTRNNQ